MSERSHERREPRPAIHHRAQEERDEEQRQEHRRVPHDRANRDDADADERARGLVAVLVRERLDEHVRDDEDRRAADGQDDLREDHAPPLCARRVARELVRRVPELLLLVARDHRPRETTVPIPAARLRARVAARHPAEELAVVDDEVREQELMRVEHERRDAQRHDRDPEVDEERRPNRHRGVREQKEVPHAHIDTGSGETRVKDAERDTRRRETTTGGNVPGTTERQVALDGLRVDLGREHLEDGRQRQEVLAKTDEGLAGTTLKQLCMRRSAMKKSHYDKRTHLA